MASFSRGWGAAFVVFFCERFFVVRTRNAARVAVGCCGVQLEAAEVFCGALRCVARLWEAKSLGELMLHFFCAQSFWGGYGRWVWEGRTLDLYKKPPDGLERTESGVKWIPEIPGRTLPLASVLQSLERASDSLGVCATRGTSSISDSLLGIEAADVALLVVRVLAAAIPSEDYWRFSDVSRGVRAAPRRAPTSEGLRQGPQPHTSRCVRPRTAVRAATPPSCYLLSEVSAGVRAAPESSD